ncbi:MAG: hypothetical protein DI601_16800 [Azospirillum brasilense]|nr:MAG: hypothetical protein DI601_16800 [Azospirillum brasilense]
MVDSAGRLVTVLATSSHSARRNMVGLRPEVVPLTQAAARELSLLPG